MIITTPKNDVQVSPGMRSAGFTMAASEKGFRVISQTLYKDPILAQVRELVCNGWDGQQAMPRQAYPGRVSRPIEVHLPTELEPWFAVRDYGIGMPDSLMFGTYTTVFESTKDDNNDCIGALGLGSKTPFAYNNGQAFAVTSIHRGIKAVYTAYLKRGAPDLTCLIEPHATSEADGVEVKVPVKIGDFEKFYKAAKTCLMSFTMPEVISNREIPPMVVTLEAEQYQLVKQPYSTEVALFVRMGHILYPIQSGNVDDKLYRRLASFIDRDYGSNKQAFVLDFPIGAVDIQASREELHYCDMTVDNINKRLQRVHDDFLKDAQDWLDTKEPINNRTAWDIGCNQYKDTIVKQLTVKGNAENIGEWIRMVSDKSAVAGELVTWSYWMEKPHKNTNRAKGIRIVRDHVGPEVKPKEFIFIHDDLKSGGLVVTKEYVTRHQEQVYYYHDDKYTTRGSHWLMNKLESNEFKVLLTSELREAGYIPAKGVNDATGGGNAAYRAKVVPVFEIKMDADFAALADSNITQGELESGEYCYAPFYKTYIEDGNGKALMSDSYSASSSDAQILAKLIVKTLYPGKRLIISRRSQIKKVKANPNAIEIFSAKVLKALTKRLNTDMIYINKRSYIKNYPSLIKYYGVTGKGTNLAGKYISTLARLEPGFGKRIEESETRLKKHINDMRTKNPALILVDSANTDIKIINNLVSLLEKT